MLFVLSFSASSTEDIVVIIIKAVQITIFAKEGMF